MRPALAALAFTAMISSPAGAIVGPAPPAHGWASRAIVMIVDPRGDLCTGTALTRELVLTAGHCVGRPLAYRVRVYQNGQTVGVRTIATHPRFSMAAYTAARATADVALLKLEAPLPDSVVPATLAPARRVAVGETLTVAGFGVTQPFTPRGLGIPRAAALTVTGQPGSLQIRLVDPQTRDNSAGLGACTGDSGGPAFEAGRAAVIGIIAWSTGPQSTEGCGGLTGLTPLLSYRQWVVDTAAKLGAPLPATQ
ncbi:S1 family peptidase [Pseudolabrys sp.]|uniref:S1 family peptidase n=1 Tax=Pseudolabrys sp. TaxID=1960880 RepID=UPI003D14D8A6